MNSLGRYHVEVTDDLRAKAGRHVCVLGRDVTFDKASLEASMSSALDDLDTDLLVVVSSVAYVDRLVSRRRGTQWARNLSLAIPVYCLDSWLAVRDSLVVILRRLTGDAWSIDFTQRHVRNEMVQQFIPSLPARFEGATVIPYSGGLDSFAAVARHRMEDPGRQILLVNARHSRRSALEKPGGIAEVAVPYGFRSLRRPEGSYRTRTFVYFSLAALAWHRNAGSKIWIGESGVGCIGPSLVPFGIEQPVCGSHPRFTEALAAMFRVLWGRRPPLEFPHLWKTKGQALDEIQGSEFFAGWQRTRSCSRNFHRQHPGASGSHCGVCAGCLFRRMSIHAAGLPAEPGEVYFEDVLAQSDMSESLKAVDREGAVCAVVAMDELSACIERLERHRASIVGLGAALNVSVEDVHERLEGLLRRHRREWHGFLARLPQDSWILSVIPLAREVV